MFTLPKEYYALINSVLLNENGNTSTVLSTGKIIEYSHSQEKIISDSKQISRKFDFVITNPYNIKNISNSRRNIFKVFRNQKEYLI